METSRRFCDGTRKARGLRVACWTRLDLLYLWLRHAASGRLQTSRPAAGGRREGLKHRFYCPETSFYMYLLSWSHSALHPSWKQRILKTQMCDGRKKELSGRRASAGGPHAAASSGSPNTSVHSREKSPSSTDAPPRISFRKATPAASSSERVAQSNHRYGRRPDSRSRRRNPSPDLAPCGSSALSDLEGGGLVMLAALEALVNGRHGVRRLLPEVQQRRLQWAEQAEAAR
ncbi:hypothetical protein EYF80_053324 [Liparis tanakae]|uniref:Uncharacterized protein n=1 Tax=Liparis tanakae TaxID=230148 RepID=A0A4Z2F6W9_9TELE|nr:hypothetical protein EYF80_053324 [Liparis tanakae]